VKRISFRRLTGRYAGNPGFSVIIADDVCWLEDNRDGHRVVLERAKAEHIANSYRTILRREGPAAVEVIEQEQEKEPA
jgi:hypothetical protein